MPYTATQLSTYYTSLTGVAPDASTSVLFQAYANQNANMTLTDAQTLANVFNSVGVQNTFEVAESTFQFFFGTTTTAAGLANLEGLTGSGNTTGLTTATYNGTNGSITAPNATAGNGTIGFNTENRYYNFVNNYIQAGAVNATTGQTFVQTYGSQTIAQTIASAYELIVGSSNVGTANANAAIADIQARVNNGGFNGALARIGGVDAGGPAGQNIGLKGAIVGYILEEANKADVGTYAKAIDQFEASVAAGNAIYNTNALTTYQTGGAGFNTGVGLSSTGTTTTGTTIALTPGTDTINNSSATVAGGNVTYVGQVGGNAAGVAGSSPTLGPSDTISAAGSNNTLLVTVVGNGAGGANVDASGGALLSGIQTINVRGTAGGTVTLAQSVVPGSTVLNDYLSSNTGVSFTGVSGSTTVGLVGNGSISNSNLTAQFVSGTTANLALSGGLINTAAAGTDNIFIQSTGGTAAGTVNITSTGASNRIGTLNLQSGNTTALNITATTAYRDSTLNDTGGSLTSITATGAGAVNVGNATAVTTLTTVNALNNTGGFTGSFATAAGNATTPFTVTTGSGVDNVTVDNATANTNVNTSGGGDTITVTGTVTAGATLNGGGNATLGISAAQFANISGGAFGTAAQLAQITGFSTVGINTALTAGTTYDVNTIGAQNFRTIGVAGGGAATANVASVTQVSTGPVVTFSDTTTAGALASANGATSGNFGTLTINEVNAATSTNDILNLRFQIGSNNLAFAGPNVNSTANVVTQGVETVNVSVTPNASTGLGTEMLTLGITDFVATAINFTGSESFTFNAANSFAQLKTINSTNTGNAMIDVSQINTATGAAPLTLTTGAGNDVVTVRDFTRITTGSTTANASGAPAFDTVQVATTSSGQTYSSVLDAKGGTVITFGTDTAGGNFANTVTGVNTTKITLNTSTAVFQDFLDAAHQATAAGGVAGFDFGGNTYLVEHGTMDPMGATFQNGFDSVIQLVGIHTISTASTATTVVLGS